MDIKTKERLLRKVLGDEAVWGEQEVALRCPFCGDSKRDPKKKRGGYNYKKDAYHCFNCGIGFPNALPHLVQKLTGKDVVSVLAEVLEGKDIKAWVENEPVLKHHNENTVPNDYNEFLRTECRKVDLLANEYTAVYLRKRKLDTVGRTFYFCHDQRSRYFGRLIIPFFNEKGDCVYFQARYLGTAEMKIKYLNPHGTKNVVFGLDKVDRSKPVPVLEGPFNAMFVENAVAVMSSAPSQAQMDLLEGLDLVFMFDNDEAGLKSMKKMAGKGYKVIKWPEGWGWGQDVNDYVQKMSVPKPKLYLETFVKPALLHPFQAEVILTMELKKRGLA